jgi:general secretion pathway protein K
MVSFTYQKKLQGSALLTALFIMTLVAIVATAMSTRLQLDIYRTQMTLDSDKIYLASQAGTILSMAALANNKNTFSTADAEGKVLNIPNSLTNI